jgi:hypothetical protein
MWGGFTSATSSSSQSAAYALRNLPGDSRAAFSEALYRHTPPRLRRLVMMLILYGAINFLLVGFGLNQGGVASRDARGFTLRRKSLVVRHLSEAEYRRHKAYEARMETAGETAFFAFSAMMLVAAGGARDARRQESHSVRENMSISGG